MKPTCCWLGAALVAVIGISSARASAVVSYEYEGNFFDTFVDNFRPSGTTYGPTNRLAISLDFAAPLAPNLLLADVTGSVLSFSAADGTFVLDDSSSDGFFLLSTDAFGNITDWTVRVAEPDGLAVGDVKVVIFSQPALDLSNFLEITTCSSPGQCSGASDDGRVTDSPGTWTLIPEPATASLLALGLAALGYRRSA